MKRLLYFSLLILVTATTIWLIKNNYHKPVIKVKQINQLGKKGKISYALKDILEERYRVVVSDEDYEIIIDDVFGDEDINEFKNENIIKIFHTAEAYSPDIENYDLALGFDHINHPKYIRYPNYYIDWKNKIKASKKVREGQGECNPHKEKFACFLVSNGSKEMGFRGRSRPIKGTIARDSMFHKLSEYKKVESGGTHLNNIGGPIPRKRSKTKEWLSQCKFMISYENQYHNGYITEKVFQAYFAGAIPIYWGDKTAITDINKNAVIYADDFDSENELIEYIKKVDNDDELYCKIWNQNIVIDTEKDYELLKGKLRKKLFKLIETKLNK